ncbi:MAG: hypothetical protein ACKO04_04310 [Actinomycetes bacterium]
MEPQALAALAATQCGLVATWQLPDGVSARSVFRPLVRSGRVIKVAPGVYSFPGVPESWSRHLWTAHLHAGPASTVSHESAARLHGFEQVPVLSVLTVLGARQRDPDLATWHRSTDLQPGDIVRRDGLPVTTPARTVVDLGSVLRVARLRQVVEQGILERKFTAVEIACVLERVRRRGKPGVAVTEAVLDIVGPGTDIPHSELERLLDRAIQLAGLPPPVREFPLPSSTGTVGFVDRCWPEARWIVEADGRRWHGRHQQMRRDADRSNEAAALGYLTTRLLWEQLQHDVVAVARLLRSIYDQRVALFAGR